MYTGSYKFWLIKDIAESVGNRTHGSTKKNLEMKHRSKLSVGTVYCYSLNLLISANVLAYYCQREWLGDMYIWNLCVNKTKKNST